MRIIIVIQARMSSSRLPEKVITDLCGKPMIVQIVNRAKQSKLADSVIVATSDEHSDDLLADVCREHGICCFRGSLEDVLDRYYQCAQMYQADTVVRLTGDNALIDPSIIDAAITSLIANASLDYVYYGEGLPLGTHIEVIRMTALQKAWTEGTSPADREHVTIFVRKHPELFNVANLHWGGADYSRMRFTMDTPEDEKLVRKIYEALYTDESSFTVQDAIRVCMENPEWLAINDMIVQRSVGFIPRG